MTLIAAWMKPADTGTVFMATRTNGVPMFAFTKSDVRVTVREDDGRVGRVHVLSSTLTQKEIDRLVRLRCKGLCNVKTDMPSHQEMLPRRGV